MSKLVESQNFQDTGCSISTRCTRCPLSQCRHDGPQGYREYLDYKQKQKDLETMALLNAGMNNQAIAKQMGMSVRAVQRVFVRTRERKRERGNPGLQAAHYPCEDSTPRVDTQSHREPR